MFLFFIITIYPENGPWTKECCTLEETMRAYSGLESNKNNANECTVVKNFFYTISKIASITKKKYYFHLKKTDPAFMSDNNEYYYCNGEILKK